jgi:hypothetical protein
MLFPVALLFCTKLLIQSPTLCLFVLAQLSQMNKLCNSILGVSKVFLYFSLVMAQSRMPISKKKKGFELWKQFRTDQ